MADYDVAATRMPPPGIEPGFLTSGAIIGTTHEVTATLTYLECYPPEGIVLRCHLHVSPGSDLIGKRTTLYDSIDPRFARVVGDHNTGEGRVELVMIESSPRSHRGTTQELRRIGASGNERTFTVLFWLDHIPNDPVTIRMQWPLATLEPRTIHITTDQLDGACSQSYQVW